MINLIRNELTKIFKKKSIYITLFITLLFIIVINVIYINSQNGSYGYDPMQDVLFYEEQIKAIEEQGLEGLGDVTIYQAELDTAKLVQKYGDTGTWQASIIYSKIRPMYLEIAEAKKAGNEQAALETQKQIDALVEKIDSGDWRYFAQLELQEAQDDIEKQIATWRLEKDIPYGRDYFNQCLIDYEMAKRSVMEYESSQNQEDYYAKQQYYSDLETMEISKYDIENKVQSGNSSDARGMLLDGLTQFELFIMIMLIMITGTIVSEEFNKGTIKLLLIKPYKRSTILASKFLTCIIMLAFIILSVLVMQFVVGGIIQGFDSFATPAVVYNHDTNQIQELSIAAYLGMQILGKFPIYLLLMTLAFAFSTIFTNSALAITITLLGYMGAPMINMVALQYELNWIKFFVTPNWDLTQYFFGNLPQFEGLTPMFSLAIIVVYMIIMLVTTFTVFKKKNIKNI